jgi:site-specific DNA-methyltransferase (adenine-specific)
VILLLYTNVNKDGEIMNMKELYNKADYKDELGMCFKGDCLDIMKNIPDKSVDMILCDLPYGTTACKWDTIIPFEPLWEQYNRIIKDNGAIVLTASQPFTTALIMSNIKNFKYEWIWEKTNPSNIALANKQPMKYHENVCVFYKKQPTYNKQMIPRDSSRISDAHKSNYIFTNRGSEQSSLAEMSVDSKKYDAKWKNPSSILKVKSLRPNSKEKVKHPTQKPVALMEYLIRTYTNEGETVLDNCMGSGTTCVACKNTNRKYIGIELDSKYFDIACERLSKTL